MEDNDGGVPPILVQGYDAQLSLFRPENLLREARRRKRIAASGILNLIVIAAGRLRFRLPP